MMHLDMYRRRCMYVYFLYDKEYSKQRGVAEKTKTLIIFHYYNHRKRERNNTFEFRTTTTTAYRERKMNGHQDIVCVEF